MKVVFVFAAFLGFVAAQEEQTPCPGGYRSVGQLCILCEAGQYTEDVVAYRPSCTDCPVGTISASGSKVCTNCPEGFTTSGPGASTCIQLTQCPAGQQPQGTGCVACPAGQYQGSSGRAACQLCPVGQYQSLSGQASCNPCATSTSAGSTTCTSCSAGQRLDGTACVACPAGTYQPSSGFSTTCLECATALTTGLSTCPVPANCAPGEYPVNNVCTDCPTGTYQPAQGGTSCLPCPAGTSSSNPATTQCVSCGAGTFQDLTGQASCKPCTGDFTSNIGAISCTIPICTPGNFLDTDNVCKACGRGTFQSQGGATTCTPCVGSLTTRQEGSTSLAQCVARCGPGTFETPSGCDPCTYGRYQPESDQGSCLLCGEGTITRVLGATAKSQCKAICGPGNYLVDEECIPCGINFYQDLQEQTECKACDSRLTTRQAGSTRLEDCIFLCPAGNTQSGETCSPCGLGTYQPVRGLSQCINCASGRTTYEAGAMFQSQCLPICSAGTALTGSICSLCGKGFYQPLTGQRSCLACPDGTSTDDRGSDEVGDCIEVCQPGTFYNGTHCAHCALGSYQPAEAAKTCLFCPQGLTTLKVGATASGDCQLNCAAGSYWNGSACIKCGETQYQPQTGQRQCDACPAGRRAVEEGATSVSMCLIPCPAGQTLNSDSACVPCARDFYKSAVGFGACSACPTGYTTAGSESQADTACYRRCEAGEELSEDSCVPCPVGEYQPTAGERACSKCQAGYSTSGTGKERQEDCTRECPAGTQLVSDACVNCTRGFYKETRGLALCTPCPAGLITAEAGTIASASCNVGDCPPGTFTTGTTCTPCPLGTYQPVKWATKCEACPANHLTSQTGRASLADCQFSCPAGKTPSGDSCVNCARGTYKSSAGTNICTACPGLFTTNGTGATESSQCNVAKCPAGSYRALNNLCTQCPKGHFQALTEQTSCIPCPVGFTTILDQHGQNIATSQSSCFSTNVCARDADNCHMNADCIPNGDQFSCRCKLGFSGDGVFACSHLCDDPGYCNNNGICQRVSTTVGAHCLCNENYSGDRCETQAEESDNLAVIIGSSVGGFIFLLLLILLICVLVWLCCGQNVMCCQPQKEETTVTTVRSQAPPKIVTVPAIQPAAYPQTYPQTYHTINGAAQPNAVFAPESQSNYDGSLQRYKVNPF